MPTMSSPFARAFAAAALLGGLALTSPVYAASKPSSSDVQSEDSTSMHAGKHKKMTPEEMAAQVETRIQNLHDKLKVTPEQENQWNDVAQAMRDSESNTRQLIMDRHQNAKAMNAIQDLESYQKIAQAHADGLSKVINAFQSFYDNLSPDQQKNADDVFNRYEGRGGMSKASMKKGAKGDMPAHGSAPASNSSDSE